MPEAATWVDWELDPWQHDLRTTTRHLLALRAEHPALRPATFFRGRPVAPGERPDLVWLDQEGQPMDHSGWHSPGVRVLQMLRTASGSGRDALLVTNGAIEPTPVRLADGTDTL